ncbi:hypothetical protein ACHAXR_004672 [Thalassiosira sp. AJA248-18]
MAKKLPPTAHAVAGAVGGAFGTLLFYPLELLRVEMQKNPSQQQDDDSENNTKDEKEPETNLECFIRLYKKQALYRGASSMVTTMLISSYITFFALEAIRRRMATLKQTSQHHNLRQVQHLQNHIKFLHYILPKSKMGSSLLASTVTGILNVFLTTPLWNGTRRIMESDPQPQACIDDEKQQQQLRRGEPNLWEMMYQIANKEGILELWHGTFSSLLLVSNPAIQYFLYEQIRVWVLGIKNRRDSSGERAPSLQLTVMEAFVFGALSKTVATVVTYPLQLGQVLIRRRKNELQDTEHIGDDQNLKEYAGMIDCLYQQFTLSGFNSLFMGMSSKLVQTVGQASFIFVTYEQMLALVGKVIEPR